MVVGFTGTRQGMTEAQKRVVLDLLTELGLTEPHHGWCEGADDDFDHIVRQHFDYYIHLHPGINRRGESPTRGRAKPRSGDFIYPEKFYLDRDEDIVIAARDGEGVLIACPKGMNEELRSGTWATIRKARKHCVPQYIVGPNGALI